MTGTRDQDPGPGDDVFLWRAVTVFRCLALGYAVLLFARSQDAYARPTLGWALLALMGAWTAYWVLGPARGVRPTRAVLVADLVLACSLVLATILVDTPERILAGAQTLPAVWVAAAVMCWAVAYGVRGGLFAAVCVAIADVLEVRSGFSLSTVDSIVLLLLSGSIIGYAVDLWRSGRRDLARAVAVEAAARERERLAADIHDSVLQVLAFVRRRGDEVGGEAAEIGRLAGDQEARLRALVATGPPPSAAEGDEDVRALLGHVAGGGVTVTGPAGPVMLASASAQAVVGAVGAALDNVRRHAGPDARAWVLVEDEGSWVTVTVRDDGAGMETGRLEAAEREGRLGVSASIRGRIVDVGGRAQVVSAPGQGTEVELRVPRARADVPRGAAVRGTPRTA